MKLADGRTLIADENYLRESILNPNAKIVAGWTPIMPTFQGQVSEEQLVQIIAYVKSLGGDAAGAGTTEGSATSPAAETPGTPQTGAPGSPSRDSQPVGGPGGQGVDIGPSPSSPKKPSSGSSGRPK